MKTARVHRGTCRRGGGVALTARAQQPTGIRRIGVLGQWRGGSRAEIQRPLTQKELMKNLYYDPATEVRSDGQALRSPALEGFKT